jgi:hypothetical protein
VSWITKLRSAFRREPEYVLSENLEKWIAAAVKKAKEERK